METLVNKIYTHAQGKGYNGTEADVREVLSNGLNEIDILLCVQLVWGFIATNGYSLTLQEFDDKFFKWFGTRPKGR